MANEQTIDDYFTIHECSRLIPGRGDGWYFLANGYNETLLNQLIKEGKVEYIRFTGANPSEYVRKIIPGSSKSKFEAVEIIYVPSIISCHR